MLAAIGTMVLIAAGTFRPFDLKKDQRPVRVERFYIDKYPVSVKEFTTFLEAHGDWRRGHAPAIKADKGYLASVDLAKADSRTAITEVSWYAARAYCRAQGKRLPTLYEWEYVATYGKWDTAIKNNQKILAWFGRPNSDKPASQIGTGLTSPHGVQDLHGLIWEWVEDFNSSTVTGDSRADTDPETNLFCGATALSGNDLRNYATYMRYGMRSSLRGNYTGRNLGFRCAKEIK